MSNPRYAKLVQGLPATVPFVGPETQERDRNLHLMHVLGRMKIFLTLPKAIAALNTAASDIWMYGDPTSFDLRQALSTHLGARWAMLSSVKALMDCWGIWCVCWWMQAITL